MTFTRSHTRPSQKDLGVMVNPYVAYRWDHQMHVEGVGGGVAGSEPMSTAVRMEPKQTLEI